MDAISAKALERGIVCVVRRGGCGCGCGRGRYLRPCKFNVEADSRCSLDEMCSGFIWISLGQRILDSENKSMS